MAGAVLQANPEHRPRTAAGARSRRMSARQEALFTELWLVGMPLQKIVLRMNADLQGRESAKTADGLERARPRLKLPPRVVRQAGCTNRPWPQRQLDIVMASIAKGLTDQEISDLIASDLRENEEPRSAKAVARIRRCGTDARGELPGEKLGRSSAFRDAPLGELPRQDLIEKMFGGRSFEDDPRAARPARRIYMHRPDTIVCGGSSMSELEMHA